MNTFDKLIRQFILMPIDVHFAEFAVFSAAQSNALTLRLFTADYCKIRH